MIIVKKISTLPSRADGILIQQGKHKITGKREGICAISVLKQEKISFC